MTDAPPEKPLSPWWRHAVVLVMAFGFTVLTVVTVLTYTNAPPIPSRVTDSSGTALFRREDIERGQEVFLKHALMEHGTLGRHGAYLAARTTELSTSTGSPRSRADLEDAFRRWYPRFRAVA